MFSRVVWVNSYSPQTPCCNHKSTYESKDKWAWQPSRTAALSMLRINTGQATIKTNTSNFRNHSSLSMSILGWLMKRPAAIFHRCHAKLATHMTLWPSNNTKRNYHQQTPMDKMFVSTGDKLNLRGVWVRLTTLLQVKCLALRLAFFFS